MKKISFIICLSILTICTIAGLRIRRQQALSQQHIASQIIRLHVIANSDETADQTLKKEVKDQVVTYLRSKMNQAASIQAARQIICQEMDALKEIAEKKCNKTEQAQLLGAMLAEKAKAAGITAVVFDRNGYLYHGRVKALADAARNGGLNF